jgi:hypothetical protein
MPQNSYNDDPNFYSEPPSRLEMAIALFSKQATSDGVGSVHSVSVRIPTIEYYSIEALAKHSSLSRNKVIVQLLELALDEVWQGMDDENREAVTRIRSEMIGELRDADGNFVFPGSESSTKGEI